MSMLVAGFCSAQQRTDGRENMATTTTKLSAALAPLPLLNRTVPIRGGEFNSA